MWRFQYFSFCIEVIIHVCFLTCMVVSSTSKQSWKIESTTKRCNEWKRCSETFSKILDRGIWKYLWPGYIWISILAHTPNFIKNELFHMCFLIILLKFGIMSHDLYKILETPQNTIFCRTISLAALGKDRETRSSVLQVKRIIRNTCHSFHIIN